MEGFNNGSVTSTLPPPLHGEDILQARPIDESMVPIYEMQNFILGEVMVLPPLSDLNQSVNLADWDEVVESLDTDLEMWMEHYISYVIAAAFGCLFAIAMPIIGCCICCCRDQGKCGANSSLVDQKRTKYKRWACNTLLGSLAVLVLLGVVATFIANQLVWEQTRSTGISEVFHSSLSSLQNYKENTLQSLWNLKENHFEDELEQLEIKFNSFHEDVQKGIGDHTNAGPLLRDFESYTENSIPSLMENIMTAQNLTNSIVSDTTSLESLLEDMQRNMTIDLNNCTQDECLIALEYVNNLTLVANYSQVESLDDILNMLISVTEGNYTIYDIYNNSRSEYDLIQQVVYDESIDTLDDIASEAAVLDGQFELYLNKTHDFMDDIDFKEAQDFANQTLYPNIEHYDDIRYYVSVTINSLSLLVITAYFLGLLYGVCGERAGPGALCCNRGNGASVLITAVTLTFAFCWIFIMAATLTFAVGGLSYTEFCRHLLQRERTQDLEVIDDTMTSYLNISVHIGDVMLNCREDMPFYQAFKIEDNIPELNISSIFELDKYEFDSLFYELNNANYTLPELELLDEDGRELLLSLDKAIMLTDFNSYHQQLDAPITSVDLIHFAGFLRNASNTLNDSVTSNLFNEYAEVVETIKLEWINPIHKQEESLESALHAAENDMSFNISRFVINILEAEDKIDDDILVLNVQNITVALQEDLRNLAYIMEDSITNDVGKCNIVYNSIWNSITSVCVQYLYPFNAFWFAHGWCFFFYIPLIIVAFYVVSLYRKTDKYLAPTVLTSRGSVHRRRRRTLSAAVQDVARRQSESQRLAGNEMMEMAEIRDGLSTSPHAHRANVQLHYIEPSAPVEPAGRVRPAPSQSDNAQSDVDDGGFGDYDRRWRGVYIVGSGDNRNDRHYRMRPANNRQYGPSDIPPRQLNESYF